MLLNLTILPALAILPPLAVNAPPVRGANMRIWCENTAESTPDVWAKSFFTKDLKKFPIFSK